MANKNQKSFKTLQSQSDQDYFLKLHLLLSPDNMKLILKEKAQKLPELIKIKELYNNVYSSTYTRDFKSQIRKSMQSKVTLKEAKRLCEFINARGITENGLDPTKKIFFNDNAWSNSNENNNKIISTSNKINKNSTIKTNNKNSKKTNNIVDSKHLNSIPKNIITTEEKIPKQDQQYDIENINKFVKRNTKEEKPSFQSSEKPTFIKQIKQVKQNKISLNTFPFNEKDKIDIEKQQTPKGETIVHLDQKVNFKDVSFELPKDRPVESLNLKEKILADKDIKSESGEVFYQEKVYDYRPDEEILKEQKEHKHDKNFHIKNNNDSKKISDSKSIINSQKNIQIDNPSSDKNNQNDQNDQIEKKSTDNDSDDSNIKNN